MTDGRYEEAIAKISTSPALPRNKGNQGGKTKRTYVDCLCTFDTESTAFKEIGQSVMYIWQFCYDAGRYVLGTNWRQLINLFRSFSESLISRNLWLVVYVHNLAYDFQYLSGIYQFQPEEVFAVKPHKILRADMLGCIELRCSYLHSNMSLDMYLKKMGCETLKTELDYSIIRTPYTQHSPEDIEYYVHDVIGLREALVKEMQKEGDTLYTIPATSTGYVRRDVRRAMRDLPRGYVKRMNLSLHQYHMAREAFWGGDTHANRYIAGTIITGVKTADRSSSYPGVLCNRKYPMSRFRDIENPTLYDLQEYMDGGYAYMVRIAFRNIRLRNEYNPSPYISYSKCRGVEEYTLDNGRLLKAEYIEITVTDIDLGIILHDYDFDDVELLDMSVSKYDYLPDCITEVIRQYYRLKTELKDLLGQEDYYTKAKNLLNSIYGMMATDIVRHRLLYIAGEYKLDNKSDRELLVKYNESPFLPYQWGVWTTAHARLELRKGIWLAGDGLVYHDTDSVYYLNDIDWSDYNNTVIDLSRRSGAYATDPQGVTHYMEVYEPDKPIDRFLTWGAKRYAYERGDKLKVTISGVGKVTKGKGGSRRLSGADELKQSGGLEALVEGYTFRQSAGLKLWYNDIKKPYVWDSPYGKLLVTSNVYTEPNTYKLSLGKDYEKLLSTIAKMYKGVL